MRPTKRNPPYPALILSLAISLVVVGWGFLTLETLNGHRLMGGLLWPLLRLLFFITLGLVVGQAIEATGWTRRLAVVAVMMPCVANIVRDDRTLGTYKDEPVTSRPWRCARLGRRATSRVLMKRES